MFFELIAVFVAGFAGAGVMLALTKVLPSLPRWLVPIGAGVAMLATAISSEYSWYDRTVDGLPDGLVVADSISEATFWRPWTYALPMRARFVAVDIDKVQRNQDRPSIYLADLYFFGRWQPVQSVEIMVDCENGRRADPALGDGSEPVWRDAGPNDPVVSTICQRV
ncbi:hypothetical protein SAMN05421853_1096 [Roseivivax halotolerans]|jgi:hypothetical protein|uniref:Uncharacterized protein n=1 Tax=Roseivivax halotolerans TaxID=93684 RepID=A0A1I5ZCN2_9RHOB|nr:MULTISPECIES: hypothetical protein [Roseivivax]QFT63165.1 hypothetical protein FIU91_09530 [Roseivivax sp. THAF30]SFQ54185.1 hypothetical protein SAMN05421853_1096 [Roseivivax halotolerans]